MLSFENNWLIFDGNSDRLGGCVVFAILESVNVIVVFVISGNVVVYDDIDMFIVEDDNEIDCVFVLNGSFDTGEVNVDDKGSIVLVVKEWGIWGIFNGNVDVVVVAGGIETDVNDVVNGNIDIDFEYNGNVDIVAVVVIVVVVENGNVDIIIVLVDIVDIIVVFNGEIVDADVINDWDVVMIDDNVDVVIGVNIGLIFDNSLSNNWLEFAFNVRLLLFVIFKFVYLWKEE